MTRFLDIRGRNVRRALVAIALLAISASLGPLRAQAASRLTAVDDHDTGVGRFVIRPFVGAYLPTGNDRDFLKDGAVYGAQASWNALPSLAITATIGWGEVEEEASIVGQKLDAVRYDIGLETRSEGVRLGPIVPFIGAGVGGRTYSYDDLDIDSQSNFVGYGALGIDVSAGIVGMRIETRDNVSRFKPLTGQGASETRNDVTLFAALAIRF